MDFVQSLIWHLKHKVCLNKLEIWLLIYSMKVKFQNKQLSSISCSFFFLQYIVFSPIYHIGHPIDYEGHEQLITYIIYHNPRVNLVELCDLMTWNTGYYTWQINPRLTVSQSILQHLSTFALITKIISHMAFWDLILWYSIHSSVLRWPNVIMNSVAVTSWLKIASNWTRRYSGLAGGISFY